MNARLVSATLFAVSAFLFFMVGFRSAPRNWTYIVLGIVFAMFAAMRYRSATRKS